MHGKTPEPRRPPAYEWFNSVHLWRRNRDGNEESTGGIFDEVWRIAANIAKPPTPRWSACVGSSLSAQCDDGPN